MPPSNVNSATGNTWPVSRCCVSPEGQKANTARPPQAPAAAPRAAPRSPLATATARRRATAKIASTLTLTTASGAHTVTIGSGNNSLDGLAAAINGADAGVSASVVIDNGGARLVIKGETGAANAFTLTNGPSDTADVNLQRFTFDGAAGGMTRPKQAIDSIVKIDGVQHQNSGNKIDNPIMGVA